MTENAPAHTPGPWIVDDDGFVYDANGHQEQPICDTRCFDTNPDNMAEIDANARLIAAAPDLLAAAKAAWDALDNLLDLRRERKADTGDAHEAIIEAHGLLGAAIAKATGNSQDIPTPAPGTDATTADGRFVNGPGYGGERM